MKMFSTLNAKMFDQFLFFITDQRTIICVNAPINLRYTAQNGTFLLAIVWFKNGVVT